MSESQTTNDEPDPDAAFELAWQRFLFAGHGEHDLAPIELLEMFKSDWMTEEIMQDVLREAFREAMRHEQ